MTQPGLQEQGVSHEDDTGVYQLAVNRGFRTKWDKANDETRKKYAQFRQEIECVRGVINISSGNIPLIGDYNPEFYEFFTAFSKEDAETLKRSILENKLSKEVNIDKLPTGPVKIE
jgi:hypothetical protein